MISVMIVDDQRYERMGLALMLQHDSAIEVTAQAEDGRVAIETLAARAARSEPLPDVTLMDVRMPHLDGIDATRLITRSYPQTRVLILTTYDQDDYAFGGLSAGASGFLLKDATVHDLCRAVHAVAEGDAVLTPRVTREVIGRCVGGPKDTLASQAAAFSSLTPRERDVAAFVAEGLSNAEIAERITVEPASVRRYVSRILSKLGLRDRVQIAVAWYKAGM